MQCHYLVPLAWNINAFILSFKPQLRVLFLWLICSIHLVQTTVGWNLCGLRSPPTLCSRCECHLLVFIIEKNNNKKKQPKRDYYAETERKGRMEGDACRGQRIIAARTSPASHTDKSNHFDLNGQRAGTTTKKKQLNTHLLPSCVSFFHLRPWLFAGETGGTQGTPPVGQRRGHKTEKIPTAALQQGPK